MKYDTILEITCPFCKTIHKVKVNFSDYQSWCDGELTQDAFPYLSGTEREQLISNLCPTCQKEIFGF